MAAARVAKPSPDDPDTAAALQRFRDLKPKIPDFQRIKVITATTRHRAAAATGQSARLCGRLSCSRGGCQIISMGDGDTGKTCLIKRYCVDQVTTSPFPHRCAMACRRF